MRDGRKPASSHQSIGKGLRSLYAPPNDVPAAFAAILARLDAVSQKNERVIEAFKSTKQA